MSEEKIALNYTRFSKPVIFAIALVIHLAAFVLLSFHPEEKIDESKFVEARIFKLVDVQEFVPPPETVVREVENQPALSEKIEETKDVVKEKQEIPEDAEFVSQHLVSNVPGLPAKKILSRLIYPQMAKKQGIEGVVVLELFIDAKGKIKKINVLKDPGYGFAEAAVSAVAGVDCVPALVNGKATAVRYRYPIRFKLN